MHACYLYGLFSNAKIITNAKGLRTRPNAAATAAVEPSNDKIAGHEIVDEDLRQKCLWNTLKATKEENDTDKWWDYMSRVHSHCYNVINEDCSKRAF